MKRLLLVTVSFFAFPAQLYASSLEYIHTNKKSKPVSSFQIAGVYFVPEYKQPNYIFSAEKNKCTQAGYTDTDCPENKYIPTGKGCPYDPKYINPADCVCKTEFSITSCSGNKILGDTKCDGKAKECVCPAKYQYTSANCTDNKSLSGENCDGKYENCSCNAGIYKYDASACKSAYGTNATVSGSACGGKYDKCSCSPSPMTGWSENKPSCFANSGDYLTKDNGCKKTYYKCGNCTPDTPGNGWVKNAAECTLGTEGTTKPDGCGGTLYQCVVCGSGEVSYNGYWCDNGLKCWLSSASDCVTLPDCAAMGYTYTSAQCSSKFYLRCPFDLNKYFCE